VTLFTRCLHAPGVRDAGIRLGNKGPPALPRRWVREVPDVLLARCHAAVRLRHEVELVAAQAFVSPALRRVRGCPHAPWREAADLRFAGGGRHIPLARSSACLHRGKPLHRPPGGGEAVVDVGRAEHKPRPRTRHTVASEGVGRRRRRRRWRRRRRRRIGRFGRSAGRGLRRNRLRWERSDDRSCQSDPRDERGCAAAAHADDREEGDEDAEQVGLAEAAGDAVIRVERGLPGPPLGRERRTLCAGEGPKAVGAADRAGGLGGVRLGLDWDLAQGHHPIAVQSSPSARVSRGVHAREGGGKAAERTCRRGGRLCRKFVVRAASGMDL